LTNKKLASEAFVSEKTNEKENAALDLSKARLARHHKL